MPLRGDIPNLRIKENIMYKCKYFKIYELVPKEVYKERGEKAWSLLDDRMLITIDALRNKYGRIIINDYYFGGNSQWRGLRTPDSPYYSKYSQHTFGRAADCIFKDEDVDKVRKDILGDVDLFPYINSVELNTSWLHFDVRNCDRITTYNP